MLTKKSIATLVLFAMCLPAFALAGGDEIRLRAVLVGPEVDISGKVAFRHRVMKGESRRQFSAEIEGLRPGSVYDVMIAGVVVGKMTVDDFGIGDINYDDNFERGDDPNTKFPFHFPALDGGERVEIGPLSGTLQSRF